MTAVVVTYKDRVIGLHESHSALLTALRAGKVCYPGGSRYWRQSDGVLLGTIPRRWRNT